jgi:hypothetical protein
MSKGLSKKAGVAGSERRKKPRSESKKLSAKTSAKTSQKEGVKKVKASLETSTAISEEEGCYSCSKDLKGQERALFVEEEIGRIFCSEECIAQYFTPEIDRLEKEFFKHLSKSDLAAEDREKFSHLRWVTLQEPDEVWRQKTLTGDYRYTLISEFKPGSKTIWCVCICLFLRNEPSFLYLAFPTKNAAMVNHYRRGEQVDWVKTKKGGSDLAPNAHHPHLSSDSNPDLHDSAQDTDRIDGLADEWTEAETLRAQTNQGRKKSDIPMDQYELYESCLEETLEAPDELWTVNGSDEAPLDLSDPNELNAPEVSENAEDELRIYHFIRHYSDESPHHWFVIVARETEDGEQLEILDSFPTRDPELVAKFRRGRSELGGAQMESSSRVVH